jgi:two-component sensor histidine kinase
VVSLLTLQGRQTSDPETRRGLDEAKLRVQAIASIHQRLYESGHHDRVDLCPFFADTFHETVKALDGEGRVALDYSCDDDIVLDVSQATPLALVVTEFITNSLKHAHPGQGGGRLTLSITRDDAKLITVSVEDDGRGVPPDFDPERPGGMGMRIVTALARQLRGRLDIGPASRARGSPSPSWPNEATPPERPRPPFFRREHPSPSRLRTGWARLRWSLAPVRRLERKRRARGRALGPSARDRARLPPGGQARPDLSADKSGKHRRRPSAFPGKPSRATGALVGSSSRDTAGTHEDCGAINVRNVER